MSNRLGGELSPYLLQHAQNPVDWFPWGEEGFALARAEQRPIFLSIGYASCHWCHVMAHEAFDDPAIARFLSEHFVSIKVDREERFDLDQIYMEAVQMMTGSGGWPLSVFLTPTGEPFFGGTYWPPHARGNIAGFDQVLGAIADAWQHRREELVETGRAITQTLQQLAIAPEVSESNDTPAQEAEASLRRSFDSRWGGFGGAPKFPQPLALRWLLRRWRETNDEALLKIVALTLDRMADGGLFDHLGGGFHRYCVEDRWLVPHFEKMLYDNALLAVCYLEAWQATGNEHYAQVVRKTLDYLLRDMTDPQGGFYSGEDADSEGQEGKFYLWTPGEIKAVLQPEAARLFCSVYDVNDEGDIEGGCVLKRTRPLETEAKLLGHEPTELAAVLDAARRELLVARAKRVRPGRDEKILVGWNGLAIDALARAGKALDEPRYTTAAQLAADFLWKHLRRSDGRLLHYWRNGTAKCDAYLDDCASLGNALLTLYENDRSPARLEQAVAVADAIVAEFADKEHGGFFYTGSDHEPLIVRKKDWLDNPTPSGNGLATMLLLRLQAIVGGDVYGSVAGSAVRACMPWVQRMPSGALQWFLAPDCMR
jgi:uncharacterized protein